MALESLGLARSLDELKHFISTTSVPVATKLGRMMSYLEGLLAIKSLLAYPFDYKILENHMAN